MFPLNGYNVVGPIDPTNLLSSGVFEEGDVITTSGGATATITLIEGNIFYYEYQKKVFY